MTTSPTDHEPGSFLWLDFEFTGLDPLDDVVIEVGAVATTGLFEVTGEYTAFINYPDGKVATRMCANPWWVDRPEHMGGMLTQSAEAPGNLEEVATELELFAAATQTGPNLYLAGNSIHNDRLWVARDFPGLMSRLHYRMLDVSSLKLVVASLYGVEFPKREKHRAIDDVHESIAELRFILDTLQAAR